MMTIRRQIEGRNFTFFCESWSNSRAWGHRAVLMQDGRELQDQKCRYYNRTWECWQYQSICEGAVLSEIERLEKLERIATGQESASPLYADFDRLERMYFAVQGKYCDLCANFEKWLYNQGYFGTVAAMKDTPKVAILIN